jgi:hypothetical protein
MAKSHSKSPALCVVIGCPAEAMHHKAMCQEHAAKIAERAAALDVDGLVTLLVTYTGADPVAARQSLEGFFMQRLAEMGGDANDVRDAHAMFMQGSTA